jgi:hypothetical protein
VFLSFRRAILFFTAFETNSSSSSKHRLSLNVASSVSKRVNPNKDSSAFGNKGSSDYDFDLNSSSSNKSKKKFISCSSLFSDRYSESSLFRFFSANINFANNSFIADAIFYSKNRFCKKKQDHIVAFLITYCLCYLLLDYLAQEFYS